LGLEELECTVYVVALRQISQDLEIRIFQWNNPTPPVLCRILAAGLKKGLVVERTADQKAELASARGEPARKLVEFRVAHLAGVVLALHEYMGGGEMLASAIAS
jgi:hypothetical protein